MSDNNESIINQFLDSIEELMISPDLIPLGSGGFGEVFTHPHDIRFAFKRSKQQNVCKKWKEEASIQQDIEIKYGSKYGSQNVRVVPVYGYVEKSGHCYILMERICPLQGDPEILSRLNTKSVQGLFGTPNALKLDPIRGIYVGRNILRKYFNVYEVAKELGQFLGFVQYGLGYDANDLEFLVGATCDEWCTSQFCKPKVNVIDFGMVQPIDFTQNRRSLVRHLRDAYDAVEYYPIKDMCVYAKCTQAELEENDEIYKIFEETYISTAEEYGHGDLAREVLELD